MNASPVWCVFRDNGEIEVQPDCTVIRRFTPMSFGPFTSVDVAYVPTPEGFHEPGEKTGNNFIDRLSVGSFVRFGELVYDAYWHARNSF